MEEPTTGWAEDASDLLQHLQNSPSLDKPLNLDHLKDASLSMEESFALFSSFFSGSNTISLRDFLAKVIGVGQQGLKDPTAVSAVQKLLAHLKRELLTPIEATLLRACSEVFQNLNNCRWLHPPPERKFYFERHIEGFNVNSLSRPQLPFLLGESGAGVFLITSFL